MSTFILLFSHGKMMFRSGRHFDAERAAIRSPFVIAKPRSGAGVLWTPLPKAEAPTEPAGETAAISS